MKHNTDPVKLNQNKLAKLLDFKKYSEISLVFSPHRNALLCCGFLVLALVACGGGGGSSSGGSSGGGSSGSGSSGGGSGGSGSSGGSSATQSAPTITTQPSSVSVVVGSTASFNAVATGTASLSYQWQKNGGNISGATLSNYTTPITVSGDNGTQYTVVITNSAGSVTSSAAVLYTRTTISALLPHSGITASQCYQEGSNTLVACSTTGALALNTQQDGHRSAINPMSFSDVPNLAGGNYPLTSCVKDNVTGLIWEGKESSTGAADARRKPTATFTNYNSTGYSQKRTGVGTYVAPTLTEINASTNSVGYVGYINSLALCGYTDWRLPTTQELIELLDYGLPSSAARLSTTWFPNSTSATVHWADGQPAYGTGSSAPYVYLDSAFSGTTDRTTAQSVRLVRGASAVPTSSSCPSIATATRYRYETVVYGNDAANNVAVDSKTGLKWRRCTQGQTWDGTSCSGTQTMFDQHENVLKHAQAQTGWRLPNVKELGSIAEQSCSGFIDATAFPNTSSAFILSATPNSGNVWGLSSSTGKVSSYGRYNASSSFSVRLLLANP